MATTRLVLQKTSRPFQLPLAPSSSLFTKCVRYQSKAKLNGDRVIVSGKGERKPVGPIQASVATINHITTSEPVVIGKWLIGLAAFIARVRNAMLVLLRRSVVRRVKKWNLQPQMLIETVCTFKLASFLLEL